MGGGMMGDKRLHRTLKVAAFAVTAIVITGLFAARVAFVNAAALSYPVERHALGSRVELAGSYAEYKTENTDGLSMTVTGARRMSCSQYLDEYVSDRSSYDSFPDDKTDMDALTLLVLDIEIANNKQDESDRGYLDSIGWSVVPDEARELWLRVDHALFGASVPQIDGAFQLSVKPGTTFTVHVPFDALLNKRFPAGMTDMYRPALDAGSYSFTVTNIPVRHVVDVEVK